MNFLEIPGYFGYAKLYEEIINNIPENETIIESLTIKAKYRSGYFKIKRQWNSSFIFGPLIWELGDNFKYLGVTKENKLVIIDSGNGGVMLLVAFPIMGAGGGQVEHEYERIK